MADRDLNLELKITDRCDQGCFFCMNNDLPHKGDHLSAALFNRRLREFAGDGGEDRWRIAQVRITGGEPLLQLGLVVEVAENCRELGIPVGINTSASLLDVDTAQTLARSGIRFVKISFDAPDAKTLRKARGRRPSFDKTLDGIRNALSADCLVVLRLTLSRHNHEVLVPTYRLACDLGVEKLQIKPLVAAGRAERASVFLSREEIREAFRELAAAATGERMRPEILCWPPSDTFGMPHKVCASLKKIYVVTNGDVHICNYLPLAKPVGRLRDEPLAQILERRAPAVYRSPVEGHVMLQGCPLNRVYDAAEAGGRTSAE